MEKQEILEYLKYGERITFECKKAENKIPNSVWETYSSFANTNGGLILFGVEEHMKETDPEKKYSFVNISNIDQRLKDFWNTINSEKVSVNILVDSDVGYCEINGATIMYINVPRADYQQRPVYLNGNPMKGSFKRNHEGDYHCTPEEVKAMLRDANDQGNDGGILDGYTMDDIDEVALKSYRIEFEHQNPDHVWNGKSNEEFLIHMGAYARNRSTNNEGLTVAGLLMFGKGLSIRERFDNIRMDYIDETDLISGSRWSDRLTYDGMWENNLYNFFKRVMPKLISDVRRPFRLEGIIRIDDTAVHKAIREAVVNMMIHSDYMINGILKIVKTNEGFLFFFFLILKLPISTIYEGGHSVARNPRIQTMFRMIGYGDNIGSGFPTILSAWGEENWRKPDLCENTDVHHIELKLWMVSMMPQECTEYLQKLYGLAYSHLKSEEQIILGTAYLEKEVTNIRMQSILSQNRIIIGRMLSELVEKGMLVVDRKGRWTTYTINTDYTILPEQTKLSDYEPVKMEFKNEADRIVYDYLRVNRFITNKQICEIVPSISTRQGALNVVNRLIEMKLIRKVGNGRATYYEFIN